MLLFLLGLIHLIKSWLDRIRGCHILQFDRSNRDSHIKGVENLLQFLFRGRRNLDSLDGQHVGTQRVAHDSPIDRLRDISDRTVNISNAMQVFVRVVNPVLNHPFDVNHLEVSRQHQRFGLVCGILAVLGALGLLQVLGAEAELLLEHSGSRHEGLGVDAEGQLEMQARVFYGNDLAEAFDDGLPLGLNGINRGKRSPNHQNDDRHEAHDEQMTSIEVLPINVAEPFLDRIVSAAISTHNNLSYSFDLSDWLDPSGSASTRNIRHYRYGPKLPGCKRTTSIRSGCKSLPGIAGIWRNCRGLCRRLSGIAAHVGPRPT